MSDERIKDSILQDVKQLLGLEFDDDSFDVDIMIHINTTFFTLYQLGIGPEQGFSIDSENVLWDAYLGGVLNLNSVKTYMGLRVRLLFDPPTNSFTIDSFKKQAEELEWRLTVQHDEARRKARQS